MIRKRRDYQEECRNNLREAIAAGSNKNLIVSPTGSGKGTMIADAPEALGMKRGDQMLVVVHRKELVSQLADKLTEWNPNLKVDVERANFRADKSDADVIVASIQTVGGSSRILEQGEDDYNKRLLEFDRDRVRHVFIDECHRAFKKGSDYHRVLRYFSIYKPDFLYDDPSKTLTCCTATPGRADNIGAETIVDKMVFSRDLRQLMETGMMVGGQLRPWLSQIRAYRVDTEVDLSQVSTRQGDFATKELEETVNTPERNNLIVEKYREYGEKMTFFAFTVDVQHSKDLAEAFQKAGYKAYEFSGTTPDSTRAALLKALNNREIDGLISCGALSEGVDVPSVGVGLMARPTKSSLLYRQQAGRVFRPYPSPEQYAAGWGDKWQKPYAIILDFVDVSGKHVLNAIPSLFGLRPDFNMKGKKVLEVVEEAEKLAATAPGINLSLYSDMEKLKAQVQEINLFPNPVIPEAIRLNSSLSWVNGMVAGSYQISFDKTMLTIKENTLGQFEIFKHVNGIRSPLGTASNLARALSLAEIEVPSESYTILQANASWQGQEATDKQIRLLRMLYPEMRKVYATEEAFIEGIKSRYDKGGLSRLINSRSDRMQSWAGAGPRSDKYGNMVGRGKGT